ncbi:DMT family transporter [Candidatus Dependentiae bacterium]|nr:MAG: DMT family transporter [Candidatus Dependentiae bacterium]
MWLIVLLYALFSSSFSIGKILLKYTSPIFLPGMRMALGGLILLAYQYFYAHKHFRFKFKHMKYYLQIIIFGIYITYILRFWALDYMPSFKACFLYNISPFLSSFYSYIFFRERMTRKQWIGLLIGFFGLIPILITSSPAEALIGEITIFSWPELAVLISVVTHSYSWIVMRKLIRDKSYSPMMVNGISMTSGGFMMLITAFFFEGFFPVTEIVPFFGWLALTIIIGNIICYNLYGYLLKYYTTTFLSFAGFLGPLFAAFYGWIFLGEKIGWYFFLSSSIVFVGLYLFYQDELDTTKEYDIIP